MPHILGKRGKKRKQRRAIGSSSKRPRLSLSTVNAKVNALNSRIERKSKDFADKSPMASVFVPTGSVFVLNDIATGDNIDQREGRRITTESLLMRYHIRTGDASLGNYRLMIVWDRYPGGVKAVSSDILDFSGVIDGEEALAPLNLSNRDRFQVLYDDTNGLGPGCHRQVYGTSAGVEEQDVTCKHYINLGEATTYASEINGVAQTGALYLVVLGNQWTSATSGVQGFWTGVFRTRFSDA